MCGIVGALVFEHNSFCVTEQYITRMRDTMVHRGPDGEGVWVSSECAVGMGFRRLAIIDLSTAALQPMSNTKGTVWLLFNGEIYNHAELRAELERLGEFEWKTDHSDTEVILRAFEVWGIECIHRLRGMFAIAIWDTEKRELWLVRDRLGVKPLYYATHHGRIVFASEIKALLEDPDQVRAIDEESFFHYLSFLSVPAPRTLFSGIRKLPPGTWMRVRADGSTEENRYWDPLGLARADFMVGKSEEEITCRIVSELRTTVKLHKVSDVPVGVFLSGGIDSSANTALISEGESAVVKTFSIGYQGNYRSYDNELAYAQRVAEKFGSEYHERLLRLDDLIHFLPEMARLQDEPLADPVCVPVYYVSKLARDTGVSVCQVGEGADELFCGYPHWKLALRMESISSLPIPYWFRRLVVQGMTLVGLDKDWRYEFMRRSSLGQPVYWGSEAYSQRQKEALLSPRMRAQFAGKTSWEVIEPIRRRFETQSRDSHPLDWMTYLDLSFRLPELLLMRVDKMSMGVSLEARVPFLDHKFVELAMSIPAELKIRGGELKYILRKALRGIIPDQIIDRKKQGFAAPIEEWFNQGLGEVAKVQLKEFCEATDLLDWPAVDCLLSGERSHRAWPLLNVALWWSTFIKPSEELRPCSREQFQ